MSLINEEYIEFLKMSIDLIQKINQEATFQSVLELNKIISRVESWKIKIIWFNFKNDLKILGLQDVLTNCFDSISEVNPFALLAPLIKNKHPQLAELSKLYIKYEDLNEELELSTFEFYNIIDERFAWDENNEEFIEIEQKLDKITEEIKDTIILYVKDKTKFYTDYYETIFKTHYSTLNIDLKSYIDHFMKNYMLKNFREIYNYICLDVVKANNITDLTHISIIVEINYDHVKAIIN
jgi:hypothetical protein